MTEYLIIHKDSSACIADELKTESEAISLLRLFAISDVIDGLNKTIQEAKEQYKIIQLETEDE